MALGSRPFLSAKCSEQGYVRGNNEDRVYEDPERGLFMVVDGMGGQAAGEIAADIAVDRIRLRLERQTDSVERRIREAIAIANNAIFEASQTRDDWQGMACVLTVAVIENREVTVGHVGDSRLYRIRKGKIEKLTHDHSPVGEREESLELSEEEAMRHPRRNEVYRDVGSQPRTPDDEQFIEVIQTAFDPACALLLCSDGLSDVVPSAEILKIVEANAGDVQAAIRKLVDAANQNSKDNVSVLLIEGEEFAATFSHAGRTAHSVLKPSHSEGPGSASIPGGMNEPKAGDEDFERKLTEWRTRSGPPVIQPPEHESRSIITSESGAAVKRPGLWTWQSFLCLLAGLAIGMLIAQFVPAWRSEQKQIPTETGPRRLVVSPLGIPTIAAALDQARPGDVIELPPGEYLEPIRLKEGVDIVAQRAREAIIKPALVSTGTGGAITGRNVHCRVVGVSVNAAGGIAFGIVMSDSNVDFQRIEITGAKLAGIEFSGNSRGLLQGSYIHHNAGAGVTIRQHAAPVLENNIILNNGAGLGGPLPGIRVTSAEPIALAGNIIADNAAEAMWLTHAPDEMSLTKNFFTSGPAPEKKRRFRIVPVEAQP